MSGAFDEDADEDWEDRDLSMFGLFITLVYEFSEQILYVHDILKQSISDVQALIASVQGCYGAFVSHFDSCENVEKTPIDGRGIGVMCVKDLGQKKLVTILSGFVKDENYSDGVYAADVRFKENPQNLPTKREKPFINNNAVIDPVAVPGEGVHPLFQNCVGWYINDDRKHPNCKMEKISVRVHEHIIDVIFIVTLRVIRVGEELLVDYGPYYNRTWLTESGKRKRID